ncbi:Golgi transport complex subunit COG5 [Lachancea thermotolerans CBS 6340]|uniref:Conserved oligomeric Golgi complex subunit 5 n=1 Tax=Lachancea thermotolerans (strain ATCC 56472 / CBS 6340 / NRRL Y-8284) TaxID=559295 RepID=C5DML0_LACTC|nr:KLTH0G09790p [Lachancea thermotolerans CBS 6340]CAR25021.1 KLTH0G09790p [Lachancea thermotolerans CBS 6340]
MSDPLAAFEDYLTPDFNASRTCNKLLKASNPDLQCEELDLVTPLKKVKYHIEEIERRNDDVIKANPSHLIESFDSKKIAQVQTRDALSSSLEYLSMSYKRLDAEVLEPYQKCLLLRSALSKIHQTSSILRDVSIFLHLLRQVTGFGTLDQTDPSAHQKALILASIHSQIQTELSSNPNLGALELVKKYDVETILPSRRNTVRYLSDRLFSDCANNLEVQSKNLDVTQLAKALYELSQKDFITVIDRVLLSKITNSTQTLSKTITSIKTLPAALETVMKNGRDVRALGRALNEAASTKSTLLKDYLSHKKHSCISEMFWSRVSKNFKREFEISFNRGGPVGKSLAANSSVILESIINAMKDSTEKENGESNLEKMLDSVAILNLHTTR